MDSQRQAPALQSDRVSVFVVGKLAYTSPGEANRAAEAYTRMTGAACEIHGGTVDSSDLRLVKTVNPTVPVEIPSATEIPQAWYPAAVQEISPEAKFVRGADIMDWMLAPGSAPTQQVEQGLPPWRTAPICGVVTVNNEGWMPKSPGQAPPSLTTGQGMYLSAQFAILFNGSSFARRKHRWAVVTTRGTVLILTGIKLLDRPINPSDFPACVQSGLAFDVADRMTIAANTPRCEFARVPKLWAVALRRADSVEIETEGGASC